MTDGADRYVTISDHCSVCQAILGMAMMPESMLRTRTPPKCHDCIRAENMTDRIIAAMKKHSEAGIEP